MKKRKPAKKGFGAILEHLKKRRPVIEKEYLVTDSCGWKPLTNPEEYNPYDPTRAPHAVELVDTSNGSVVRLTSGSIIKIVKYKDHEVHSSQE